MGKIHVLPSVEAQKIAAGEVVERPASVVKELVENSIDAGASSISLYLEKSGKTLIRVVDDGCGMARDDARTCFLTHATSKIRSLSDLEKISSFGFRGEAMSSISSVSKVELSTVENNGSGVGVRILHEGGKVIDEKEIAGPIGTDIKIKDLFYNTPVRKKFLKQDETEWNQSQQLFQALCLSHLGINFRLYRDGKKIINAPAVDSLHDRVAQIWGHDFSGNMCSLRGERSRDGNLKISGITSHPRFYRYGRQQIFFFVNGRWIKNQQLSRSVLKGYQRSIPEKRFPASAIFIELDSDLVDVNVHPRKEEVMFRRPGVIEALIQDSIQGALEEITSKDLEAARSLSPAFSERVEQAEGVFDEVFEQPFVQVVSEVQKPLQQGATPPGFVMKQPQSFAKGFQQTEAVVQKVFEEVAECAAVPRVVGQLLGTYIVVEKDNALVIIDQHAAHERILYERMRPQFEKMEGVQLLFPAVVELSGSQCDALLSEQEIFSKSGINFERFGTNTVRVSSMPHGLQQTDVAAFILEMCEFIMEHERLDKD
ncbi:DNA mismatch repair endonuclease MutL, partial [bacterium]|nr:DNA mismatch repair endonuclease MutL [bacterium]